MTDHPYEIPAAYALAHVDPQFWQGLTDVEQLVAQYDLSLWLRPDQLVPRDPFVSFGFLSGRGYGKTMALAYDIQLRVEAGEVYLIGLAAPSDDRIAEVQVHTLCEMSPPWCKARPYGKTGVRWDNGAEAIGFTPQEPERPRSSNLQLTWSTEIVDWAEGGAWVLYANLCTATRTPGAVSLWDTTSKGRNPVIQILLANHAADPVNHRIVRGSMLDSHVLDQPYIASQFTLYPEGTREHDEEIKGLSFQEATGARWDIERIEKGRVREEPRERDRQIVSVDPALTKTRTSDEIGIIRMSTDLRGDAFIERDLSGKYSPEEWGEIVLCEHDRGASCALFEVNHIGDLAHAMLRVLGETRESRGKGDNIRIEVIDHRDRKPVPPYRRGVLWVKEIVTRVDKDSRASAAASLYAVDRAHHVGRLSELENEMITWEPGKASPNRLDALTQGLIELTGVAVERARSAPLIESVTTTAAANAILGRGNHRSARDLFRRGRTLR